MLEALASADLAEDHGFLVLPLFRDQRENGLPDYFARGVAEDAFRGRVPGLDDTVKVLADDGIAGRLDERQQMPGSMFMVVL
jgi:hypothetical protein